MLSDIFDSVVINFHTGKRIFVGQYDACIECAAEHANGILCVVCKVKQNV